MEGFNSISPYEFDRNPFKLIGKDWGKNYHRLYIGEIVNILIKHTK